MDVKIMGWARPKVCTKPVETIAPLTSSRRSGPLSYQPFTRALEICQYCACIADRSLLLYPCPEGVYLARERNLGHQLGVTELQRICDGAWCVS